METNSESPDVFLSEMNKKTVHILSLDGGGSKGLMEARILDLVLKTTTLLLTDPKSIQNFIPKQLNEDLPFLDKSRRSEFVQKLDEVTDTVEPVILFDIIVGTSTGGLIAFGLGGVMKKQNDERLLPLTVKEVMKMYFKVSEKIFSEKAYGTWDIDEKFLSWIAPSLMKFYSQNPLKQELEYYFGDKRMKDFNTDCIIGCVSKRLADEKGTTEKSVFFNSVSIKHMEVKIVDALLATTDAPVYFQCPVVIDDKNYVDGGLGANCPLAQALELVKTVYGVDMNVVVLSIAPPSKKPKSILTDGREQIMQWLEYFPSNLTHGDSIFNDCKQLFGGSKGIHHIRRIIPDSDALRNFKMDETHRLQEMLDETTECVKNGQNGNSDDGILAVVSQAITQLVPFFSNLKKSRNIRNYLETKGLEVKSNEEIYNALIPLTLTISQRYDSMGEKQKKASIETLEAGLQIIELMNRDQTLQDHSRNHLSESRLYQMLGKYYREIGNLVPSHRCFLNALKNMEMLKKGNEILHYVNCLIEMGDTLMYMGQDHTGIQDSSSYFEEAKSILEEHQMDISKVNLRQAQFFMLKGNYARAIKLLKNSRCSNESHLLEKKISSKIKLQSQFSEDPEAVTDFDFTHMELEGFKCLMAKDYEKSQEKFEAVLRMRRKAPFYEVARIINLIGITCLKTGQNFRAEKMFRSALSYMDKTDGHNDGILSTASPITAAARNAIGVCIMEINDFPRAQKSFEKSLDMLEKVHGERASHPDIRDVLNNIAVCQLKQGHLSEAGLTFQKAKHHWNKDLNKLNDVDDLEDVEEIDGSAVGGTGTGQDVVDYSYGSDPSGGTDGNEESRDNVFYDTGHDTGSSMNIEIVVGDRRGRSGSRTVSLNHKAYEQMELNQDLESLENKLKTVVFFQ